MTEKLKRSHGGTDITVSLRLTLNPLTHEESLHLNKRFNPIRLKGDKLGTRLKLIYNAEPQINIHLFINCLILWVKWLFY